MEVNIGRPKALEVHRIEVIHLRLIKTSKEGCDFTHRVRNCGKIVAHLKSRRGSGKWTYQESIKHDMKNCDLRRINSQGRKEGGDKGKKHTKTRKSRGYEDSRNWCCRNDKS